jgi:hypothetical protein
LAAAPVNLALSLRRVLADRCHHPAALKRREGSLLKSSNMRLGVAGPGPHLFFAFIFIEPKKNELGNLGPVFAMLPQDIFSVHSFCTIHFDIRFIFAYAGRRG